MADQAVTRQGSWWPDYAGWLGERSPPSAPPRTLGNRRQARSPRRWDYVQTDARGRRHGEGLLPPEVPADRWLGRPFAELRWQLEPRASSPTRSSTAEACREGRAPAWCSPGFLAGDFTLLVMRDWLRRIGYRPYTCGFVANVDCSNRALERVERRVDAVHSRHGRESPHRPQPRRALRASAARAPRPDLPRDLARRRPRAGSASACRPECSWQERGRASSGAGGRRPRSASPRTAAALHARLPQAVPADEVRLTTIFSKATAWCARAAAFRTPRRWRSAAAT